MKYIFGLSILFISIQANGQYSEWINSDRPGAGMSPYSIGKNVLQVQAGYTFSRLKYTYGHGGTFPYYVPKNGIEMTHQERTKFRLGIAEQVEINAAINYQTDHTEYSTDDANTTENYIERVEIGFRGCLLKAKGYTPAIGLELRMLFPRPDKYSDLFFSSTLSVQEAFSDYFSLTANVIYTQRQDFGFALNAGVQITQPIGIFIEIAPNYYLNLDGEGGVQTVSTYFNFGGSWSITRNFQVDLAGSVLTNKKEYFQNPGKHLDTFFSLQAGLSARLDWRH